MMNDKDTNTEKRRIDWVMADRVANIQHWTDQ